MVDKGTFYAAYEIAFPNPRNLAQKAFGNLFFQLYDAVAATQREVAELRLLCAKGFGQIAQQTAPPDGMTVSPDGELVVDDEVIDTTPGRGGSAPSEVVVPDAPHSTGGSPIPPEMRAQMEAAGIDPSTGERAVPVPSPSAAAGKKAARVAASPNGGK